jgi:Ca2+-binding RTX toxin-like protein
VKLNTPFFRVAAASFSLLSVLGFPLVAEVIDPGLNVAISRTNHNVILSWPGSNGVPYQVESSSNFVWTGISLTITGTGPSLFFTNSLNPSGGTFFRIKKFVTITATLNPATGVLTVIGNELDNSITVSRDGTGTLFVNNGAVPVTGGIATVTNTVLVEVFGRAGNDQLTMDQSGGTLPAAHLFGEEGNDVLAGSSAVDQLFGGPGSDTLTGRAGNDLLDGGADDDNFVWNPGDGSDTLEGQGGNDALVFNGANINEMLNLSTNGARLRLTRDVGAITMDINGVETVTVNALGGADTITVNSLAGTGVMLVNLNLTAAGGIDDAQTDSVVFPGSAGVDTFSFVANAGAVEASGLGALVRVYDATNTSDTISITGVGGDLVDINGSAGADAMTVIANGTVAQASTTGFPIPVSVSGALTLAINGLGGSDTITCSGSLAAIVPIVLDGGNGDDIINGGNGADTILGGNGNDTLDGNQGNDTIFGGADNDTFVWDPGDGSDTLEGQGENDVLVFNGSNINEVLNLSTNGSRLRLTRDVATITMDINGVEQVNINALGGADNVTINTLVGTAVTLVNVNLAGTGGIDDGLADVVTLPATAGADTYNFVANAGAIEASGFGTLVRVYDAPNTTDTISIAGVGNDLVNINGSAGADTMTVIANGTVAQATSTGFPLPVSVSGALTLTVNGLGGADNISCSGNLAGIVPLVLDGGDGDDTINGSNGADTILGGNGNDTLDGNQGNDVVFGGADDETFRWDPGDGSDTLEGQSGNDALVFNGSNINEMLNLSTNGSRLRLTRDVGAITMDINGVETVTVNALGGADTITVNSLAGTGLTQLNLDLAAFGGAGDGAADAVAIYGTAAADAFTLTANAGAVDVSGITPSVKILHPEPANDVLTLNGLAGTDTFNVGTGVTSLMTVITNQ